MDFTETLERVKQEAASVGNLFNAQEDGAAVRKKAREAQVLEAINLFERAAAGSNLAFYALKEAMTTSDFPLIMGDVLDRALLASYMETPQTFRAYAKVGSVRDFRTVKRFAVDGGEAALGADTTGADSEKIKERAPYPEEALSEAKYEYAVEKYGRRYGLSWEQVINDDLDAFTTLPARMARAARRGEERFVTTLFANNTTFFHTANNANRVTGNPALTVTALETAFDILAAQTDEDSEPIVIEGVHLVVPPQLEIAASQIINTIQREIETGSTGRITVRGNGLPKQLQVHVNHYLPSVDSSFGTTGWYIFADPNTGRPAIEVGFLRGHEAPEIFMKRSDAVRVGGGEDSASFDNDAINYKLRHVWGGTVLDPKAAVFSEGDGS